MLFFFSLIYFLVISSNKYYVWDIIIQRQRIILYVHIANSSKINIQQTNNFLVFLFVRFISVVTVICCADASFYWAIVNYTYFVCPTIPIFHVRLSISITMREWNNVSFSNSNTKFINMCCCVCFVITPVKISGGDFRWWRI